MRRIIVVDYDPAWPVAFENLRAHVWNAVGDFALAIEHVGSTSVPGLAAKPIIDMVVIVPSPGDVPRAIERLATLRYVHRGNLGIEDREAFQNPPDSPAHHLYVCPENSLPLRNFLAVRDALRSQPETAGAYGELKKSLAAEFADDIDGYIAGKTDLLLGILREAGFATEELHSVERVNRRPTG